MQWCHRGRALTILFTSAPPGCPLGSSTRTVQSQPEAPVDFVGTNRRSRLAAVGTTNHWQPHNLWPDNGIYMTMEADAARNGADRCNCARLRRSIKRPRLGDRQGNGRRWALRDTPLSRVRCSSAGGMAQGGTAHRTQEDAIERIVMGTVWVTGPTRAPSPGRRLVRPWPAAGMKTMSTADQTLSRPTSRRVLACAPDSTAEASRGTSPAAGGDLDRREQTSTK